MVAVRGVRRACNIEVLMERAAKSEIRSLGTARNDVLASQQVRDLIIRSGFPLLDRDNKMDDVHIAAKATGWFFSPYEIRIKRQHEVMTNYFHNNILVESNMTQMKYQATLPNYVKLFS